MSREVINPALLKSIDALNAEIAALKAENAKLRAALMAVRVDAINCPDAETPQWFIGQWAMDKVRAALGKE